MTPEQMAELAARLRERNAPIDRLEAADLIDSMAQRVPLSAEQIKAAFDSDSNESYADFVSGVLFAEQAHGIRSEE